MTLFLPCRWFCSSISREKADECLKSQRSGTFMVRQSQKRVGEYSLSVSHDGTVKHFRVDSRRESRQRYQLYGARRSFSSLVALVDYYSQMSISVRGEVLSHPYCMVGIFYFLLSQSVVGYIFHL